jgi:GAF domain-containing protein
MARRTKPAKAKVEAKAPRAKRSPKSEASKARSLEKRLSEALEQHAAISEILNVMSASPSDVQPVLDAVAERAARLCEAPFARVLLIDGPLLRTMAQYSLDGRSQAPTIPVALGRTSINGRAVVDRATVHHGDVVPLLDSEYPDARQNALRLRFRAVLAVPLMREGNAYGAIFLWRREPGLFSREQVALVQTFAQQAAIAVDNVRLFRATKEALEQQTATSEILRVISQSPTDAQPAFETIAAAALKLCRASSANVFTFDGELIRIGAIVNVSPEGADAVQRMYPRPITRDNAAGRAVLTRGVVSIPDIFEDSEYKIRETAITAGFRSVLGVPLLREGTPIGAIVVGRPVPGPFPEKQVALLQTFADQAVIAIENVRLFKELDARNRELTEALEQQTATSDILRVISQSPTDVQPVFDTIAAAALKLCRASSGNVFTFDGELIHLAAIVSPKGADAVRNAYPRPPGRDSAPSRAVLTRRVVVIPDVLADAEYAIAPTAIAGGFRSILAVPLLHEGHPIGAITVGRPEPGSFPDAQVALLKTFADQAVIAIENVRLFKELETRNRDLAQALEQQTATSDILRVISQSPTDVQPVFDTIAKAALELCRASSANVFTYDGELVHVAAMVNLNPTYIEAMRKVYPRPLSRATAVLRAIQTRSVVTIPDVLEDSDYLSALGAHSEAGGFRSILAVPLMREGHAIGGIAVGRAEPGPFPDAQVALLKTFADQAVIAIENVRLFNETKEALEHQKASAEVLGVISSSVADTKPVFDKILESCERLFEGHHVGMTLLGEGNLIRLGGYRGPGGEAFAKTFPYPLGLDSATGTSILQRRLIHFANVQTDDGVPERMRTTAWLTNTKSQVLAPMIWKDRGIGAIFVGRPIVHPFSEKEIALLKTFADQAVIAIENVRLFTELEARTTELTRSVGELKALGEVGQAVSSTLDLETVLSTIVSRAAQLAGMNGGSIWEYDEVREEFHLHATDRYPDELVEALRAAPIRKGEGALGRLAVTGEPVEIRDIVDEHSYQSRVRELLIRSGYRSVLAVPLLREDHLLGALAVNRNTAGEFAPEVIELLKTFATQSALAIQNARLFREIEVKGRQLEVASQHKSEFLANMSHELRTPLNAIIGFSEVLSERMFGEINDKQAEYLADILESGLHLLSLINDILDLSKIEAGRMELEPTDFDLPSAIENALILVRERAQRRAITLQRTVDERLGMIRADERKVKQVLLNLLSNALKFTPEGGRVDVRASVEDGVAEISVTDTGVGIAPEDQQSVFEEFRQVGTAAKKVEGTGLGLAISRRFIELHGGTIRVESQIGSGSTFTFTLPLTIDQSRPAA